MAAEGNDIELAHARESVRGRLFELPGTPVKLGRFELIEKLGEGGMGLVFSARDGELEREVAVKLLHSADPTQAKRLLREARAMARLSHPNVVTVYESGTSAGQVYLVMEFVPGQDLRRWLAAEPRTWRDIVPLLIDAARGLAAAHDAGLIHRDFKPENVLVGDDGRAKVADFGLARAASTMGTTDEAIDVGQVHRAVETLTRTGSIAGTPAYLPPEVLEGGAPDARGDQFSFCVAAYEALCGRRPFAGDNLTRLHENIRAGRVLPPLPGRRVPAPLRRALVRGLSAVPEQRHPSIDGLVRALTAASLRRRRQLLGAAGLVGAAAVTFALIRANAAAACTGAEEAWAQVWSPPKQAELAAAMGQGAGPNVEGTVDRVSSLLDAYGQRWTALHREICLATRERGEQSTEVMDLRMACLHGRRTHVQALLASLQAAKPEAVQHAVMATQRLPEPESCAGLTADSVTEPEPDDPELRARIQALRARLAEAEAFDRLGDQGRAAREYEAVQAEADAVGYRPLMIDVRLARSSGATQHAATRDLLYEAIHNAETIGDLAAQRAAWTALVAVHAYLGEYDASERAARHGAAFIERAGNDPGHRAELLANLAFSHLEQSEFDEAVQTIEEALQTIPDDDAHELKRSEILASTGTIYTLAERNEDALAAYEQAYAIQLAMLGPQHETVANTMFHLGRVASRLGRLDESNDWYERASATFAAIGASGSSAAIFALNNLGQNYGDQGRHAEAIAAVERALAAQIANVGPDHRYMVRMRRGLAEIYLDAGEVATARRQAEEALRVSEATFGDTHDETASTRRRLAQILLAAGDRDRALALLERALVDHDREGVPPVHAAITRYWLFRALIDDPKEVERVRTLAEQAVDVLAAGEPNLAGRVEELRRWLAAHPG